MMTESSTKVYGVFELRIKRSHLLLCGHGEALQTTRHVTEALLEGCHQMSLKTHTITMSTCFGQTGK